MNGQLYGQTNAIEQYPQSGFKMPQLDALRRARMGTSKPLYQGSADVMANKPGMGAEAGSEAFGGGAKPMQLEGRLESQMGAAKPMMMQDQGTPMAKPGMRSTDRIRQPAMDMNSSTARMFGRPTGRGLPGVPKPAPIVNVRGETR